MLGFQTMPLLKNPQDGMPRAEYPSPMWKRSEWYCLNGTWDFAYDFGNSGELRGMVENGEFPMQITVPFCPESKLSGIGNLDFMSAVWYRKNVRFDTLPEGRALLHFGAVDYEAKIWVNGQHCGTHKGGYTAFAIDITKALQAGDNEIIVCAKDDNRIDNHPCGKQCIEYKSKNCSYSRTTGIWQTVWLEFVPDRYLLSAKMTPHAADGWLEVLAQVSEPKTGDRLRLRAYYQGKQVGQTEAAFVGNLANAKLDVTEIHLWEIGSPELYDLTLELVDGNQTSVDLVESYFAMRDVSFTKRSLTINGKPVFMRTVLDQGFYPDGVYTAPSAEDLKKDIELSMGLGFNGARFHQRVFEQISLYYADTMGYIVWIELPHPRTLETLDDSEDYIPEWMDIVNQHYNNPSVIGWIPLNETYHQMKMNEYITKLLYALTKQMDPYRPTIDASGGVHYITDMFDVHDYAQDVETFKSCYEPMLEDENAFFSPVFRHRKKAPTRDETYRGEAFWVSEFGGTFWNPKSETKTGWGYGKAPATEEEWIGRYVGLTEAMLSHPRICGFCYTQLTDIEQEQNGMYYYDRSVKFSPESYEKIREANQRKSAIEK